MSGICGTLRLDGRPARMDEISATMRDLERRGPDGSRCRKDGPAVLGHTLLATTPEALGEALPLVHVETGCTITADLRLDNRGDLMALLGMETTGRVRGDGEVVLHAYLRWGTGCLDRLCGDFAFAIWDPRKQRLFCARDQVGMRQLIYFHQPQRLFAFATEPLALVRHGDIPAKVNEARIGDFFEGLEAIDLTSTFFHDVHRLPPAHALEVTASGLRMWRYWQLEPATELVLANDREYAEAFLESFTAAVRTRLRSPGNLGSMLSGGMDSSSVSAVAARLLKESGEPPLRTFSAVVSDPDCVETRTIDAAMGIDHIQPTRVSIEDFEDFRSELEQLTLTSGEPFDGHMTLVRAVYLAARRKGINVMLDGGGGDTTLSADNMIMWHLRKGAIGSAWREARGLERFYGRHPAAWENMLRTVGRLTVPSALRSARRSLMSLVRKPDAATPTLLRPEFCERIALEDRRRAHREHAAGFHSVKGRDRAGSMLHPFLVVGRERYDRVASGLAIEPRDPFLDLGLLELCMKLPASQFQDGGWPKVILRRATAGLLPDEVRWRVGKEHLGWQFRTALWGKIFADLNQTSSARMQEYLVDSAIAMARNDAMRHSSVEEALTVGYASAWLRRINDVTD